MQFVVLYTDHLQLTLSHLEPNESFLHHLNECLRKIDPKQSCFIMGDFNYELLACEPTDSYKNQFIDTMLENSFISLINHPTRITDTSASALDQIWSDANLPADIKSVIISDPISDHLPIIACASTGARKLQNEQKNRNISPENIPKFVDTLAKFDIREVLSETDPNNALEFLKTELKATFKKCFPIINKKINSKNTWYDDELHAMHHKMQHLYTKYRRKKSVTAKANYNVARNKKKKYYSLFFD